MEREEGEVGGPVVDYFGRVFLDVSVVELIALWANLTIGLRHPENKGPTRRYALDVLDYMTRLLLSLGVFELRDVRGWKADEDQYGHADVAEVYAEILKDLSRE